jgi:uncharacterized integral membrane protein
MPHSQPDRNSANREIPFPASQGVGEPGSAGLSHNESTPPRSGNAISERHVTRTGMVWVAVASALVILVLLVIFILQNQELVLVKFFGLEGAISLGIALFIAAVGGSVLVAIAGAARIIQLRAAAHRHKVQSGRNS